MRCGLLAAGAVRTAFQRRAPLRALATLSNKDHEEKAIIYMTELSQNGCTYHIDRPVAEEIVKTLKQTGVPAKGVLGMVTAMAGAYEIDEDAGLKDLVKAVEQEVARKAGKETVRFIVSLASKHSDFEFECEGMEGMSLKDVAEHGDTDGAKMLGEHIECACNGVMACSTCQIYIDEEWFEKVGKPGEAELDMIDLAHEPTDFSRLACQVVLKPEIDGVRVILPTGANNLFDHIPFED